MSWYKTMSKANILEELKAQGYEFHVKGFLQGEHNLEINVTYHGEDVGGACFGEGAGGNNDLQPNNDEFWVQGIEIEPQYQRKGIATAIYMLAEQVTGKKLIPSTDITPEAYNVWQQPHRPFGKPAIQIQKPEW